MRSGEYPTPWGGEVYSTGGVGVARSSMSGSCPDSFTLFALNAVNNSGNRIRYRGEINQIDCDDESIFAARTASIMVSTASIVRQLILDSFDVESGIN